MEDETEPGQGAQFVRIMLILMVACMIAALLIMLDHARQTRRLLAGAEPGKLTQEQVNAEIRRVNLERQQQRQQQPQPGGGHPPQPVPPAEHRVQPVDNLGGVHPEPPEDGDAHAAAPIVAPGDERARPPRRGAFYDLGTGDLN